ncbi:MAG: hypothetical protein AAF667_14095 [Pseudomonadota bacterium]
MKQKIGGTRRCRLGALKRRCEYTTLDVPGSVVSPGSAPFSDILASIAYAVSVGLAHVLTMLLAQLLTELLALLLAVRRTAVDMLAAVVAPQMMGLLPTMIVPVQMGAGVPGFGKFMAMPVVGMGVAVPHTAMGMKPMRIVDGSVCLWRWRAPVHDNGVRAMVIVVVINDLCYDDTRYRTGKKLPQDGAVLGAGADG